MIQRGQGGCPVCAVDVCAVSIYGMEGSDDRDSSMTVMVCMCFEERSVIERYMVEEKFD